MGQYHYLINLTKKQFVNPHEIGNGLKLQDQIGWECSTSTALVMLLAASNGPSGRGGGDFRGGSSLIGSWAGDRIAFVGDYASKTDLPLDDEAHELYERCANNKLKNISKEVRKMMEAEFSIIYTGDGWMDIKKANEM